MILPNLHFFAGVIILARSGDDPIGTALGTLICIVALAGLCITQRKFRP